MRRVRVIGVVAILSTGAVGSGGAQPLTEADRAAALIVRWQQIIYPTFEDARASIDEENTDHLNALLSQGAVRAVQDRVDAQGLKTIDDAARGLAAAMIKTAKPYSGGSRIIDAETFGKALDAVCPLYPFCRN